MIREEEEPTVFEFHVSRRARDRYQFSDTLFSLSGNVVFADLAAGREFAHRMTQFRDAGRVGQEVHPGALNAMGLIDEAMHAVVGLYRRQRDPAVMQAALAWFGSRFGEEELDRTLLRFAQEFPTVAVYRGRQTAAEWLAGSSAGMSHREVALEELILLWLANSNPAFRPFQELFDDAELSRTTAYSRITAGLHEYFNTRPRFGPGDQNLIDLLRAPALAAPHSLEGQLAFLHSHWEALLGDLIGKMLIALDVLKEEEVALWMRFHPVAKHFGGPAVGDSSIAAVPSFSHAEHEYERFSPDQDWMPRAVVIAKSVYVWLHQLSQTYGRSVNRLDQIPDEELDLLARRGFTGLWLIGLWERSAASQRIKQMCGNPEAAASAYSLYDYVIAQDLGGETACANLHDRAWARGIRLASDMVPNHMGIDSRWVVEHPDWFISLPYSPFPVYTFNGVNVAGDDRVEIKIEDHYFDRTDAAVVFRRQDRWTGDTRYIYHGNDGTSFPWNDTAQLNYLMPEVREAVIQTILHVARMFPIIRFDAAMTLTKRHYQRLWFPEPGSGGAIPSRAEHGISKAAFDAAMPVEFWREVVDRVAAEAPNTLLLAEAFWLMEGYFVRTLGMHRVYNSAFMNMLRDEENANYRSVLKNTLGFDPEVLKRYVNFMNNPDERTAVDQFGKGDKYFGVCTLMATLPGLPMFGHGQIEGYTERYGMEYRRAYHDEQPDTSLVARHEREISPLLHRRRLFAEVRDFLLYDFFTDGGHVNEDVFAYSNRRGEERALVVFHNRYAETRGWIRVSSGFAERAPDGGKHHRQRTLAESFRFHGGSPDFAACRDALTGLEYLHRAGDIAERGLRLELRAYQTHVFLDWRDLYEDASHPWGELYNDLAGRGVSSLDDALVSLKLRPLHDALRSVVDPALAQALAESASAKKRKGEAEAGLPGPLLDLIEPRVLELLRAVERTDRVGIPGLPQASQKQATTHEEVFAGFSSRLLSARILASRGRAAGLRWPDAAQDVLPVNDNPQSSQVKVWGALLAWSALQAIGLRESPDEPEAAARLFDTLRLRQPLAEALAACGFAGEEQWRAAARLRASFAHASRPAAPYSWIDDPDVTWLIGVHEHEGVSYVVKENLERLMWWMALRNLLDVTADPNADPERLFAIVDEIEGVLRAVQQGGYRVYAMKEAAPREGKRLERDIHAK